MKRYSSVFQESYYKPIKGWTINDEKAFTQFLEYVYSSNYGTRLVEWSLPKGLKEKIDFIKQLALDTGFKIKDLFKLFMDKGVFKFFTVIGWSFKKLYELLKEGYNLYKNFVQAIYDFIEEHHIVKWTTDHLQLLDDFLKKHPKTRRLVGVALGALLVYMWLTMSFIGNPSFDFDLSFILGALMGHVGIGDIFGGANGAVFLSLFMTGLIFNLSFPYPGSNLVKLAIGVLITLAKKLKVRLSKGKETEQDIEKDLKDLQLT